MRQENTVYIISHSAWLAKHNDYIYGKRDQG